MNREDARQFIIDHAPSIYLKPDGSKKGFICPICGSGTGKKGTGITSKDGNKHFTCWKGCFTNADVFEIIGMEYGLHDYNSQLKKAADVCGIEVDKGYSKMDGPETYTTPYTHKHIQEEEPQEQPAAEDFTNFFLQAHSHIKETDYWAKRGLGEQTVTRFKLGYVAEWRHPKAANAPATPRLIIPVSKHSYLARDTREEVPEEQAGFKKSKVKGIDRPNWIFNSRALETAEKPIFVVEGEIDAMSIIEAGGEAVALGSLAFIKAFLELVKNKRPVQPLIIAMDNEEDPQKKETVDVAAKKLAAGLQDLGIPFHEMNPAGKYKDANEALVKDRATFIRAVDHAQSVNDIEKMAREELEKESAAYALKDFMENIAESKTAPFYPTGFEGLDSVLDGGLYAGLYVVGAISSLGKTTFCLQVSDHIAKKGHDVLIFSLEMARDELIAKSVSRETLIEDLRKYGSTKHAKTTRGILTGSRYDNYGATEQTLIRDAILNYRKYAKHIFITEGVGDVSVDVIREKIQNHIKVTGKAPVVLIDYLQIIAPIDVRMTDKQNTDKAVLELKRMSRDYKVPIIGISSFNRDNYTAPVNLSSFKESGSIEYSSDVLLGLQYDGMDYEAGESEATRAKRIRKLMQDMMKRGKEGKSQSIQIKVLKNRNGSKGDAYVDFFPMFNYFRDPEALEEEGDKADEWTVSKGKYKR